MEQYDREFWQIARSFLIRYNEYNRQKGANSLQFEEIQQGQAKLLAQQELKQAAIIKLMSLQLKCDYHNLIVLAFLQDLAKWGNQYYNELRLHSAPLQCLITQSIQLLSGQQQFHTIVAKQNQLISTLLPLPFTQSNLQHFKALYRKLKDVKEYLPAAIRQHQKKCFLNAIEQTIERAKQNKNIKTVEYIFANIFNQLQTLQETHEFVSARLKIIKKIVKSLWIFHEQILYKLAYLLMKYSYHMPQNLHLSANIFPIYEPLLDKLLERPNIAALLLFQHVIFSNLENALKGKASFIFLEGLLSQLSQLFTHKRLEYFMRHYDWNYLQVGICQKALNLLYQYTENMQFEKKPQNQLIKLYLNRIHLQIKAYLQGLKPVRKDQNKCKFYQLKRKQYDELIKQMNEKPKKIFKRIQSLNNVDIKQATIQKYVKIIKKTAHLDNRTMIDIFSTDNPTSAQLFAAYTELILKQCKQHNLQEFVRLFTSNFFIAGESQQIARVMDTITQLYFNRQEQNNIILRSSDATYTFANAILILNTDLHNPKNQQKISEENFLKMCKKINQGQDVPVQILKITYSNIKKNKINTFRDRANMSGISVSNWMLICTDYQSIPLTYYDNELQALDQSCFKSFVKDMLSSILDEKQTSKLQILVQRFFYDDKVFQCEIIEIMRKTIDKKSHLPTHILQKIFEFASFRTSKTSQKLLSYYWLGSQIIITFPTLIPINLVCQFLVSTWSLRLDLQDNMFLRQSAEIKRVKQSIKALNKRQSKKSIMDIFSNFLSFKESDDQKQVLPNDFNRRSNFKSLSNNLFDIIKYNNQNRKLATQFLMAQIHKEGSKLYEQFVSCLFLTFNLLYLTENSHQVAEDLFYELLGLKQSQITKRLDNLGKKDSKLYNILINYCRFWILKLLLKEYNQKKLKQKQNNSYEYLLNKSLELLQKADKQILQDLVKELSTKNWIHQHIYTAIESAIKKLFKNPYTAQMQSFIQKYKNQEKVQENTKQQDQSPKQRQNKEAVDPTLKAENLVEQQKFQIKQTQKAQGQEEVNLDSEEKQKMLKKESLENIQAYIDPDAMIDQIERQIQEQHARKHEQILNEQKREQKSQEHNEKQTNRSKREPSPENCKESLKEQIETNQIKLNNQKIVQQISQSIKEEKIDNCQQNLASSDKSEETPSVPVIMF